MQNFSFTSILEYIHMEEIKKTKLSVMFTISIIWGFVYVATK